MPIQFNDAACQETTRHALFGLCDDQDSTPAYVDTIDQTTWVARVENPRIEEVTFTAIDNCIDIRRPNGDMERRCDGVLAYTDNLIFVELKEVRTAGWIQGGIDQLLTTFEIYAQHNDVTLIPHKRAFLANKKKPVFETSISEQRQRIYQQHRLRINVEATIVI
jgi:hypothetical protein